MDFTPPLIEAVLIRRYKRFLADVRLADGTELTVHCPNTGSMLGCQTPGSRVWLRDSGDPKRKYRHTWELVEADGVLVGINTARSNALVREAIAAGVIVELAGYPRVRGEVRYGTENSRIDLLLAGDGAPDCYVEVKNVTAAVSGGVALFPDAVSSRGSKHLRELMGVAAAGGRAVLVFCVQRGDAVVVRPADGIDPVYGRTLREAVAAGVEVLAYRAAVTPVGVRLEESLTVDCSGPDRQDGKRRVVV